MALCRAKPRKPRGKTPVRSCTGAEPTELVADQAEQRSRLAADQMAGARTPDSDIENVIVPNTPLQASRREVRL